MTCVFCGSSQTAIALILCVWPVTGIDVTEEEAVLILDVSQSKATLSKTEAERDVTPKCLSLKELLEKEKELGSIVTFCAKFDDMLGKLRVNVVLNS